MKRNGALSHRADTGTAGGSAITFSVKAGGYDPEQVNQYIQMLVGEYNGLQRSYADLSRKYDDLIRQFVRAFNRILRRKAAAAKS